MNAVTPLRETTQPLFSVEAEQAVLGSILIDQRCYSPIAAAGGADLFYDPLHASIYEVIAEKMRAGDLVSPVSVSVAMPDAFEQVGGPGYLVRMTSVSQPAAAMRGYAKMLGDMAHKRRIQSALSEAQAALVRGDQSGPEIAAALEGRLVSFESAAQTIRPVSMLAATTAAMAQMNEAYSGGATGGILSGIAALDRIVPGFFPGELTLLGGRPSMGKSAISLAVALNAARSGHGVAIASLEMTPEAMATRALSEASALAGNSVAYMSMRRGDMTEDQFRTVAHEAQHVGQLPITFLPRGYSDVGSMVAGTRQIMRASESSGKPLSLLIVDYAQLLRAPGRSRYEQITEISMALKALAVQLHIPVIALSQLSRQIESRDDKRPVMSDLRESGQLEQDADNVLFCYRPEYYLERDKPDPADAVASAEWYDLMVKARHKLEIIVAKQRMGEIGTAHVKFAPATNLIWED